MERQRSLQQRTKIMRGKIVDGAIEVLALRGVPGLTHRAVAGAAGVSLAATTYHFEAKTDILEAASRALLDGYLEAFGRLERRIAEGAETRLTSLDDLVARVVLNALGRERTRSLAWCEIVLHGGRDPGRRALVQGWYGEVDRIWSRIAGHVEPAATPQDVDRAVDMVVGLTFMLHPLTLPPDTVLPLLTGQLDLAAVLAGAEPRDAPAGPDDSAARWRVIQAAIGILADKGAAGVTHRSVAERAGLARSGPAHHFASIDTLLETAQLALFRRAGARYREGLDAARAPGADASRLLDLTTAVYFREALKFTRENIGYYSAWISAAQKPALRPAVAAAQLDLHRAWSRRLAAVGGDTGPPYRAALRMQALFIGMLIRAITAGADLRTLSRVRANFSRCLAPDSGGPDRG